MEDNHAKLLLYFLGKNILFSGYKVLEKIYDFNTTEITLPDEIFGTYKEKTIIDFQLILKDDTLENNPCFNFYVYFGINKAYCFIYNINQMLFDICCIDKNITIYYGKNELKEFNYLENDSRARIVLINSPSILNINNININLASYITNKLVKSNNSFQISVFDFNFKG